MGIPAFERSTLEPDLSFAVNSHYLGVPVAWREYPYEWVFEQGVVGRSERAITAITGCPPTK